MSLVTVAPNYRQCPICGKRVYCSDTCQQKQFRNAQSVTKLTPDTHCDLVNRHLFAGDWRLDHHFPDWPRYTCLTCSAGIAGNVEAWYDFQSYQQTRGVLARLLCSSCYALKGGSN